MVQRGNTLGGGGVEGRYIYKGTFCPGSHGSVAPMNADNKGVVTVVRTRRSRRDGSADRVGRWGTGEARDERALKKCTHANGFSEHAVRSSPAGSMCPVGGKHVVALAASKSLKT